MPRVRPGSTPRGSEVELVDEDGGRYYWDPAIAKNERRGAAPRVRREFWIAFWRGRGLCWPPVSQGNEHLVFTSTHAILLSSHSDTGVLGFL